MSHQSPNLNPNQSLELQRVCLLELVLELLKQLLLLAQRRQNHQKRSQVSRPNLNPNQSLELQRVCQL